MTEASAGPSPSATRPLQGRTVLITGAAGDIGRATAVRLATAGCRVVLADVADGLEATANACVDADPTSSPVRLSFDVSNEAQVATAFADLADQGITADLLFNNAGVQGPFGNSMDQSVDDFRRVLEINVVGAFTVLQHFANALASTGRGGAVVNTASMAKGGAPNMAAYSASKAAVVAMTKSAAKDLAPQSIRVNSISPAFIGPGAMWDRQVELQANTSSQYFADDPAVVAEQMIGSIPLRRYGSLDEVASVVQFLLSDEASYITAFDVEVSGGAV